LSHWEGSSAFVAGASTTLLDGAAALETGRDAGGWNVWQLLIFILPLLAWRARSIGASIVVRVLRRREHSGENLALVLTSA